MKDAITLLVLMAFASVVCITQNWWDKMTAEEKMSSALKYFIGAIFIAALVAIVLIMV
jgi:nitrate reductase gamma subunit